jgi:hypothetical protein
MQAEVEKKGKKKKMMKSETFIFSLAYIQVVLHSYLLKASLKKTFTKKLLE